MEKVTKFYEDRKNLDRMLAVVDGDSKISLRLMDWFVTNYAKKYDIIYGIQKDDTLRQFMVYSSYRAQLKAYQKDLFDPFCRHERIKFKYGNDQILRTTVGQLNFFRWAIEELVLDYVDAHFDEITDDMKKRARVKVPTKKGLSSADPSNSASLKIAPKTPVGSKKKELSISATQKISTHEVKILVRFD